MEAKADLNRCEAIYSVAVNIHIFLLQNDACVCGVLTQIQLACPTMLGMSCGPYFFSKIRNVLNSQTFLTQMVSDPRAGALPHASSNVTGAGYTPSKAATSPPPLSAHGGGADKQVRTSQLYFCNTYFFEQFLINRKAERNEQEVPAHLPAQSAAPPSAAPPSAFVRCLCYR